MDRSRTRQSFGSLSWRTLAVNVGKLLFLTSALLQILWHIVSILEDSHRLARVFEDPTPLRPVQCISDALRIGRTEVGCSNKLAQQALYGLALGITAFWWNPMWKKRLMNREIRLVGLKEYYQVNTSTLLIRFAFWVWARDSGNLLLSEIGFKLAHSMALTLSLILTGYVYTRVGIDPVPLVEWRHTPERLVSERQWKAPEGSYTTVPNPPQFKRQIDKLPSKSFNIGSLASPPPRNTWQSPTITTSEDKDRMEWEPSHSFSSNVRATDALPPSAPSPFYGVLPAKPSNRLLRPETEKLDPPREAIGLPPGLFDRRDRLKRPEKPSLTPIAEPRFFSQQDRAADTGLETLFDTVFYLRDPQTVSLEADSKHGSEMQDRQKDSATPGLPWYSLFELDVLHATKLVAFAVCQGLWYAGQALHPDKHALQSMIMCFVCLVFFIAILSQIIIPTQSRHFSDFAFSMIMIFAAFWIYLSNATSDQEVLYLRRYYHGIAHISICCCWELPHTISMTSFRIPVGLQNGKPNVIGNGSVTDSEHFPSQGMPVISEVAGVPPSPAPNLTDWPKISRRRDSSGSESSKDSNVIDFRARDWKPPNHFKPRASIDQSPGINLGRLILQDTQPSPSRKRRV